MSEAFQAIFPSNHRQTKPDSPMSLPLIIFASQTGETAQIAEWIAEGLGEQGLQPEILMASLISPDLDFSAYAAFALGSSVYQEEVLPELKHALGLLNTMDVRGRPGAAFGSCEWDDAPIQRLHQTMELSLGLRMAAPALALRPPLLGNHERQARSLGRRVADSLQQGS